MSKKKELTKENKSQSEEEKIQFGDKMFICFACGQMINESTKKCPYCGTLINPIS